jgi:hypothetical protein
MYSWVDSGMAEQLNNATSLSEVINIVHPDWSASQRQDIRNVLQSQGVTADAYRNDWMNYDDQYDSYAQQLASTTAENTATTNKYTGQGWTQGPDGTWYPPGTLDPEDTGLTDWERSQIEADKARLQWEQQQAQQDAAYRNQQLAMQRQQAAAEQAYQQQQMAMEKARNSWSKFTDESGVWQKNQLGEVQYLGAVPKGEVQNMPSTWSGWGTSWGTTDKYNPTTQRMDTVYGKTPMSYEENLAQGQFANLPGNWLNVGLMNRTLPNQEQKYNTYVGDTVGRLVSAKPGYTQNYDLQQGQAATGITPAGWYDTSANSNAWQQGYGPQYGGTGTGEGGGYQTQVASRQDYGNWNQTQKDQMGGWLDSGMSGYTQQQDYWDQMNRMRAPEAYQGVSWR